jgi:2-dehydro-3-deoxygluconokinase
MNADGRIVLVGEGMLELSGEGSSLRLGYGGDTLNTAIHLARLGRRTAFCTAMGTDPFSADLAQRWEQEGLETDLVMKIPDRLPGLYAIRTDDAGERSFFYWREQSAARHLFESPDPSHASKIVSGTQLFAFSLITLAILSPGGRDMLLSLARQVRANGGLVAFDGNYRPQLWADAAVARECRDRALACCDIGLPTLADEQQLSGFITPEQVATHWRSQGAREVVVKLGDRGCLLDDTLVPPPAALVPVDTSGAGDAFNAGYLSGRLDGAAPLDAARQGHRLASWVIMRPGAIPERDDDAPYR